MSVLQLARLRAELDPRADFRWPVFRSALPIDWEWEGWLLPAASGSASASLPAIGSRRPCLDADGSASFEELYPREQLDGRAPGAAGEEPQANQSGDAGSIPASRSLTEGRVDA